VAPAPGGFGYPEVIGVEVGSDVVLDLLVESVVEGVLATGTATAATVGECSRCLDPLSGTVEVRFTELFRIRTARPRRPRTKTRCHASSTT